MNTALTSGKSPLNGRSIAFALTLAMLMSIPPKEAAASGGPFHLFSSAGATTVTPSRADHGQLLAAVTESGTENRIPIDAAGPPILGIEAEIRAASDR